MRRSVTLLTGVFLTMSVFASENRAPLPEPADAAVLRAIVDHGAASRTSKRPFFAVPYPLVLDYFRTNLTGTENRAAKPPVQVARTFWHALLKPVDTEWVAERAMRVTVLDAGRLSPARLRLFPENTVFRHLQVNGQDVAPVLRDGWFELGLPTTGAYSVTVQTLHTPERRGDSESITLHHDGFAIAVVEVDHPEAREVRVENQPGCLTGTADGGTHGVLALGPSESAKVYWQPIRTAAARTATLSLQPHVAWLVGEQTLSANAWLQLRFLGGGADRATVELPAGVEQLEVHGPDVREYRLEGRLLTVFFRGAISGATSLRLNFVCPRADSETFALPTIQLASGRMEDGGWTIVSNDTPGILLENSVSGLRPADTGEAPATVQGLSWANPVHVYQADSRNGSARFDLLLAAPFPLVDTIADKAEVLMVVRPDGQEMTRVVWSMRNDRAQYMRVRMPEGARILSLSVEEKPVQPMRDGDTTLIPLAKSVQTLDRLLSFPIELVYCRQSDALTDDVQRAIDLPELLDVTTAQIDVALYLPEDTDLTEARGNLRRSLEKRSEGISTMTIGYGQTEPPQVPEPPRSGQSDTLSRNYYRLGYEAFKQNRYAEAEGYLKKATEMPGENSLVRGDARALLETIEAASGERAAGKSKQKAMRAKTEAVRQTLSASNVAQMAEQTVLEEKGMHLLKEGRQREALETLQQSRKLQKELQARGALQNVKNSPKINLKKLEDFEAQARRNRDLQRQIDQLQQQAKQVVDAVEEMPETEAADDVENIPAEQQAAAGNKRLQVFNRILSNEAQKEQLDVGETQSLAFGLDFQKQAPQTQDGGQITENLEYENARLEQQARVLKRAVEAAKNPSDQMLPEPVVSQAEKDATVKQLRSIRTELRQFNDRLVAANAPPAEHSAPEAPGKVSVYRVDELEEDKKIDALDRAVRGLSSGWNHFDSDHDGDDEGKRLADETREELERAKKQLAQRKQRLSQTEVLATDISGVIDSNANAQGQQLGSFLRDNYFDYDAGRDGANQIQITNGDLFITNNDYNYEVLNETLYSLRNNAGLAVPVTGRKVQGLTVQEAAARLGLQPSTTANGRQYLQLDLAQYETLLQQHEVKAGEVQRRDVLVGTPNGLAGQSFRLEENMGDNNGLLIDGTRVDLPTEQYLVTAGDDGLVVLRADSAGVWQEVQGRSVQHAPVRPVALGASVPLVGRAVHFEKTLLKAGESPDLQVRLHINNDGYLPF